MKKIAKRIYQISDSKLLAVAYGINESLKNDITLFQNSFPKQFPSSFGTRLDSMVNEGYVLEDDSFVRIERARATRALHATEKQFHRLYKRLRIYIEDAFGSEPDRMAQLGVGTITQKRRSREELFRFATLLTHLVREYQHSLAEVGCPESLFQSLEAIEIEMNAARDQQEIARVERENSKFNRIDMYNQIWAMMVQLNRIAPFVFEEDPTQIIRYALPKRTVRRKKRGSTGVGDDTSSPEEVDELLDGISV